MMCRSALFLSYSTAVYTRPTSPVDAVHPVDLNTGNRNKNLSSSRLVLLLYFIFFFILRYQINCIHSYFLLHLLHCPLPPSLPHFPTSLSFYLWHLFSAVILIVVLFPLSSCLKFIINSFFSSVLFPSFQYAIHSIKFKSSRFSLGYERFLFKPVPSFPSGPTGITSFSPSTRERLMDRKCEDECFEEM